MRLFGGQNDDTYKSIQNETEQESNEKLSYITTHLREGIFTKIETRALKFVDDRKNFKTGFILLVCGLLAIFASFLFLPFALFSPQNFCLLNSLGSVLIFSALIFIKGGEFLSNFFSREKIVYTILFCASTVAEFYFATISPSYVFVCVSLLIRLVSTAYLLVSNLPGGIGFLNEALKYVFESAAEILKRVRGK